MPYAFDVKMFALQLQFELCIVLKYVVPPLGNSLAYAVNNSMNSISVKVSKKVRRKRMNARLRRLLQPKNAIMVLNEMSETVKFTFHEPLNPASTLFAVSVEV
jgi:hypothetical protein